MNKQYDPAVFAAMQTGDPVATYQKTVVAKVVVRILNSFSGEPAELILEGMPGTDSSQVSTWSVPEDVFFKRMNRIHFDRGVIIRIDNKRAEVVGDLPIEQSSDEEVTKIVNNRFATLQNILQKTESEAFVHRLLEAARLEDKSEKVVKAIETRLSEIQTQDYTRES